MSAFPCLGSLHTKHFIQHLCYLSMATSDVCGWKKTYLFRCEIF